MPAERTSPDRWKNVSMAAFALYFASRVVGQKKRLAKGVLNRVVDAVLEDLAESNHGEQRYHRDDRIVDAAR